MRIILLSLIMSTVALAQSKTTKSVKPSEVRTSTTAARKASYYYHVARVIPQMGMVMSDVVGTQTSNTGNKTGLALGATLDIGREKLVGETGLIYRQLGAKSTDSQGAMTISMNYLTIPGVAKYYFRGQNTDSVYVKGGLLASILVSKQVDYSDANGATGNTEKFDTQTFDLAPTIGVGGKFAFNEKTDFVVEAAYMRSLTQVGLNNTSVFFSALTLTAGLGINL